MYKTRSTTEVITENKTLINDKFNSIYIKNQGDDNCRIFDNILLTPGESFNWSNNPDVIITDNVQIAFEGVEVIKQVCVMKIFVENDR